MKTLFITVQEIHKYLRSSALPDLDGVAIVYHAPDNYDWYPVENLPEVQDTDKPEIVYIPFLEVHRVQLRKLDQETGEYLIMTHIADIALSLMIEDRKEALELFKKFSDSGKKAAKNMTKKERVERAKTAAKASAKVRTAKAKKKLHKK